MKKLIKWGCCLYLLVSNVYAQQITPVIPGDFPDPSIIKKDKKYFAIGTSSEWAPHFPIFSSTDLRNWKQSGYLFNKAPEWTSASFWAPEYFYHNNTYFIYYTARRKSDNVSCIGVATSKYPDKEFTDHGIIIEHGKEAIDAFIFDDNGQLYISWKAYGLDKRPIELLASKLSADGLKLEGEPFLLLKDNKGVGIEGQSILKKDDYYYLFYSAGACCGMQCDYNVRVARSKTIDGTYEEYAENPVLQGNATWKCTGHGTFVKAPDNNYYYLYHAYNRSSMVRTGRQGMLAQLSWRGKNQWPVFKELSGNSYPTGITDNFSGKTPALYWQWDFRNASPNVKQDNGKLFLSGTTKPDNKTGIALTLRPALPHYEMQVTVINENDALKGLTVYGDVKMAVGVGVTNNNIEYWYVKDGKREVLASALIKHGAVLLKMTVGEDLQVYYKQGSNKWQTLTPNNDISLNALSPWDRSSRMGLHFLGNPEEQAVFNEFKLVYQ